ncbi:hypothetical protein SEA_DATBOI_59 [Gordonia phage DatBoi]|nr:hypothetical protein SEA_DATBOI_59 [Gordonia phage DatBoi]
MGIKTRMRLDEENRTFSIEVIHESTTDVGLTAGAGDSTAQSLVRQELWRHLKLKKDLCRDCSAVAVTALMEQFHLVPKTVAEMEQAR